MKFSRLEPGKLLRAVRPASLAAGSFALVAAALSPALAEGTPFAPQTRIRLTIVQWMPSKSEYERWDALGGEHTVSDEGEIILPILGALSVGKLDNAGLTNEIAKQLQEKIGLVRTPAVTIEILEYPPIYVVGDVTTPGEYKFRPGLTVLQSLAMSGGPSRVSSAQQQSQTIKLAGELREIDHSLLRGSIKITRLQAEMASLMAGTTEVDFAQPAGIDQQYAAGIYQEERVIAQTRAKAIVRQSNALAELGDLLTREIATLEEKLKGSDDNITSAEEQLASVRRLVEKGVTVASRQLDLERLLTTYRSDRLDLVTAIMRGRQAISETTRNLEGLTDTRKSEVAAEMQTEQAAVDQLKMRREMMQKLILEELAASSGAGNPDDELPLAFAVSRRDGGQIDQFQATETTALVPGDVVRVVRPRSLEKTSQPAAEPPSEMKPQATQASQ
jgi:polysaccharide export outer membrane protein